jgi:hypothetical protein
MVGAVVIKAPAEAVAVLPVGQTLIEALKAAAGTIIFQDILRRRKVWAAAEVVENGQGNQKQHRQYSEEVALECMVLGQMELPVLLQVEVAEDREGCQVLWEPTYLIKE